MHHDSEKWEIEKTQTQVYDQLMAIVIARVKWKADARMCVVCRECATHEEEREKGNFCTLDRFSADGFRTRAGKGRTGRPGDSRTREKRGVCVGVRSVSAGRGPEGRFMS